MAKNSVDSVVNLVDMTAVRLEGSLVSESEHNITFKARKSGGRRMLQRAYPRESVIAYGDDFLVVKMHAKLPRSVFKHNMSGHVTEDKLGWLTFDGMRINPRYAEIVADLGVEDGGSSAPKKAAGKKKAKKA